MNWEHPDDQAGFRKGREARDQIANICWIIEKGREFQKNLYFCFSYRTKAFGYVDHDNLWRILKETGISDHLTCLLRNLYAGQEATSRIGHGITDWFRIGKGVYQGFPGGTSGKEPAYQCRRRTFDPWVGKIPWKLKWLPTLVFLSREFHGQRSLGGYSPWGRKESNMTEAT